MNLFSNKKDKTTDQEIFAIYDTKAGIYQKPLFATNSLTISRELEALFKDQEQQKNNFLVTNSEDFILFKIGEYNSQKALFVPMPHEAIIQLHELKSMVDAQQTNRPN